MTPDETAEMSRPLPARPTRESLKGYPIARLALSVLFALVLWLVFWAAILTSVVQFVLRLFGADETDQLKGFAGALSRYAAQLVGYITFARDDRPFPFGSFPKD